jgi:hypothetical protein
MNFTSFARNGMNISLGKTSRHCGPLSNLGYGGVKDYIILFVTLLMASIKEYANTTGRIIYNSSSFFRPGDSNFNLPHYIITYFFPFVNMAYCTNFWAFLG